MLKTVPFQDRMEARHTDFNAVQANARQALDLVVRDAVTPIRPGYAGFNVTKNSNTELLIAAGRIYRTDGASFIMEAASARQVQTILPTTTKRIVAVVAAGREEDSRSETRDFLVDLESDTTEPRNIVVERRRAAVLDLVPGQESATLPRPAIDSGLLVIAWVTLNTTGIEAIAMEAANALPSVTRNDARIRALETWRGQIEPRINTIASDITALKNGLQGAAGQGELLAVMRDVARLKERLEIPDTASDWGADRFLSNDETDNSNIDLLCFLEEGIRFPDDGRIEQQLALFNPLDANAFLTGTGLLLPAVARKVIRLASSPGVQDGKIAIAQYGFQTHEMKQLTVARSRMRYGPAYEVCNNSQWWRDGVYDSATNTFKRNGESFLVSAADAAIVGGNVWDPVNSHAILRLQQYWEDTWSDAYWVANSVERNVGGAQIAQTFLNSQDGWLCGLNLLITDKGADGDIQISIARTLAGGTPNKRALVSHVVLPYASIKQAPTETYVSIPPVLLEAGERYAIIITTLGSHKIGIVDSNEYSQGTLFYSTDSEYYAGDLTRDLWFELEYLQFKSARVELEMAAISLSGGIAAFDVLAGTIRPKSCGIEHQLQIAGVWRPLNKITPGLLAGAPPLVRHRIVLTGTTAIAPAIEIQGSRVKAWRQKTVFKHISTRRSLATTATSIRLDLILSNFDPARHTITVRLRKDDGTLLSSTGFTDRRNDAQRITRTFAFAANPAISGYKIEITGTTNNHLVPFHVEERVDIAL